MRVRSKAPLRISLAGGGTDVEPYLSERGGCVLSCTIDRYAYCSLVTTCTDVVNVTSRDYDMVASCGVGEPLGGKLELVDAALRELGVDRGLDIVLHSDVAPGSGLGASSAMTAALVGGLLRLRARSLGEYELAELAYRIERLEAGIPGGKQDQYAAVFGGFNFIEFTAERTVVNPLRVKLDTLNELQYRLLLCYTGKRRVSAGIIKEQIAGYSLGSEAVIRALDTTRQLAVEMKNSLLLGDIDGVGCLLSEGWRAKQYFSPSMTDSDIDKLYDAAMKAGALGGKLLGAGGGGYLLFLCSEDGRHAVGEVLAELGGRVGTIGFEPQGLQTWAL